MAPLAGIMLALVGFFLLTSFIRQPAKGLVSLEKTPYLAGGDCFNAHIATETIISLTADGRVSFAVTDTALQAAVLRQVSKSHDIVFSASQLAELGALPYLATDIEQLPTHFSAVYQEQVKCQRNATLPMLQLAECTLAAKTLAPSTTGYPTSFFLYIGAETDVAKVSQLLAMLQKQGITHYYLLAHHN